MPLMRKERKSEYEHWTVAVDPGCVELEKLRQLEELKWAVQDLVDEMREVCKRLPPRRIR